MLLEAVYAIRFMAGKRRINSLTILAVSEIMCNFAV